MNPPVLLVYCIDEQDRIVAVNRGWLDFARENDGESVMPDRVLGASLWNFITDPSVQELYRKLLERARAGRPVRFDYRCDAPTKRRWFTMGIRRVRPGTAEFCSELIREQERPLVRLLDAGSQRDTRIVRVCGWCQRVAGNDGSWLPVEEAVVSHGLMTGEALPRLSHGICPACVLRAFGHVLHS